MKVLVLVRDVSGGKDPFTWVTGQVADAVVFPDGLSVLHWRAHAAGMPRQRIEIYMSEQQMREVRERNGHAYFVEER